jgi:hypothetical protein
LARQQGEVEQLDAPETEPTRTFLHRHIIPSNPASFPFSFFAVPPEVA